LSRAIPGNWSVHRAHQLLEQIEADVRATLPNVTVLTHLESREDSASWEDVGMDREGRNCGLLIADRGFNNYDSAKMARTRGGDEQV